MRPLIVSLLLAGPAAAKPNFVFILVDDLGYTDIGAYNPDTFYETPNVDRLAAAGTRFTAGYTANPVCSPTRFSIMTGKYPTRAGATNYFSGKRAGRFLPAPLNDRMPLREVTLAESLKRAGYRTAFLGKWHLGPTEKFWPKAQGFDVNVGGHQRGHPRSYFSPYRNPVLKDGPKGEYLTRRLTGEALKLLEGFKESKQPFLLYLAFYTVHTPLQAPKDLVAKYQRKYQRVNAGKKEFGREEQILPTKQPRKVRLVQGRPKYAAMIEVMDNSVGRVLDKLKELNLDRDTVVVFTSDNGGLSTAEGLPTSNLPLRGGKGWVYEGGIRVPYIIKWPAGGKPGVCDTPAISTDFYPTILDIAGLPPKPTQHRDGVSLKPLLRGGGLKAGRKLYWHYPHYANQGGFPGGAVRDGDFKLLERYEDGQVHLYNLKEDIGERRDLAASQPGRVKRMRAGLHDWYRGVGAKFLRAKPNGPEPWKP